MKISIGIAENLQNKRDATNPDFDSLSESVNYTFTLCSPAISSRFIAELWNF